MREDLGEPASGAARQLLLTSFLSLYFELVLIRWIPSACHIVGFFNNLVLIGCFLGLGIGMARGGTRRGAVAAGFFRLVVATGLLCLVHFLDPQIVSASRDYQHNEFGAAALWVPLYALLVGMFLLVTWTTMPLGQLVGLSFDPLPRLRAYSINIAGSLLGVVAFAAFSWLELAPLAWFAIGLGLLWALEPRPRYLLHGLLVLGFLFAQHLVDSKSGQRVYWTPYYKAVARPFVGEPAPDWKSGVFLRVNDQFLLFGIDLRPAAQVPANVSDDLRNIIGDLAWRKDYYNFEFELRPPRRVLVLGSGAGNDVACALRHGAEHVTAVEIDPVVLRLGREFHPEKPYDDPRVSIVLNDARAFLSQTHEKFDLIIFGTLDAHGLISSLGSVRLDSFVYTKESVAAARDHLTDDGLMVLSFGPFPESAQMRHFWTVRTVFGRDPLCFLTEGHLQLVAGAIDRVDQPRLAAFLKKWTNNSGNRVWVKLEGAELARKLSEHPESQLIPEDDWPHFLLTHRRVPREYLAVLASIILVAGIMVFRNFRGSYALDPHFFFLGAGFLLLETKSITEFALLFGATWQVNSMVFVVILVVILLANVLVLTWLKRLWLPACYVLIAASLTAGYVWPLAGLAQHAGSLGWAVGALYAGVPIFLAALIFASTFREAPLGSAALASNLLGAVCGGTVEYLSMAFGIRALSLFALAMYVASFLSLTLRRRTAP